MEYGEFIIYNTVIINENDACKTQQHKGNISYCDLKRHTFPITTLCINQKNETEAVGTRGKALTVSKPVMT
jgi:hypothetical protein